MSDSPALPGGVRRPRHAQLCSVLLALLLSVTGCQAAVPDRRTEVDRLGHQLGAMPGVQSIHADYVNDPNRGAMLFSIHADVADDASADQAAAVVTRYLHDLGTGTYRGYAAELDLRRGWNVFAVDSGDQPLANPDQIIGQARDWVDLRHAFAAATVSLRATIAHPSGTLTRQEAGRSNVASVKLADTADSTTVADAVSIMAARFAHLAGMDWTVSAGKQPTQIVFSRRVPTPAELDVWRQLNADQRIPHVDMMRINGPVTPPVWISEKTTASHDVAVALQLAARHLPIAAKLTTPLLYSASDQLFGHIGGYGMARGPVAVTIGGCTPRDPRVYQPTPAELVLIRKYATCKR
jgi:hypothetical protein